MKKILSLFIILGAILNVSAQKNFRLSMQIKEGEYLFNTEDLYFFDAGINCYLKKICNDVDSVFEQEAQKVNFEGLRTISFQAYLFTDNYEYIYTKINGESGWLRVNIDIIPDKQKNFLKDFLKSDYFPKHATYVEVMPFKDINKVFISNSDDWYIANLNTLKAKKIGTKGGRLEACQMIYNKNCVKCYIDLGWGEYVIYDQNGRKKRK